MVLNGTNVGNLILEHEVDIFTTKTASLNESPITVVDSLDKLAGLNFSSEKSIVAVKGILKIASATLSGLIEKNQSMEKSAQIRSLIDDMVEKGLVDSDSVEEKIAELMEKNSEELSIVKEATKMIIQSNGAGLFEKISSASDTPEEKSMFDDVLMND